MIYLNDVNSLKFKKKMMIMIDNDNCKRFYRL